jgi:prevent-host-death family protein
MTTIGIYEARIRWSEIISRVERGERFTITRHGVPIADLVPSGDASRAALREVFERMRAARAGRAVEGVELRDLIREGWRR